MEVGETDGSVLTEGNLSHSAGLQLSLCAVAAISGNQQVKPSLQALLIADHAYTDKFTGKKIIAGVFHHILFRKAEDISEEQKTEEGEAVSMQIHPAGFRLGSPFCYISLTEVRGRQPLTLRYVHLETDEVKFRIDMEVTANDPLVTIEAVIPLPDLPARTIGTYALELLWKDEPLGSHRINVLPLDEGE